MNEFLMDFSLGGNWVDLAFIILLLYYVFANRGFLNTLFETLSFLFALLISYKIYGFFGKLLAANFSFPIGISNAIGFFISWFLAETIFYILIAKFLTKPIARIQKHEFNKIFGYFIAPLQAFVISLFFISFIFALPVRGQIKKDILNSRTGPYFVNLSRSMEERFKAIFGEAISESLNFLTIKPSSNQRVDLGYKLKDSELTFDEQSEMTMFNLVNQERAKAGVKPLVFDYKLREVSRAYAKEMFVYGFFSHISPVDGSDPAVRANRAGVVYQVIGENLALAPDVYLSHQGLMNSEGHRKNILSPEFGKVGIGVVDGGVFGKIFVQEFTD